MRNYLVAAASAIFFAAVIVGLCSLLWPGSYLALLLVACVGLFVNGLLNAKLVGGATAAAPSRDRSARSRSRGRDRANLGDGR